MKLIFTFLMLVVIRFGSELPIPGVKTDFFANFFANQSTDAFGFFNAMTGGSLSGKWVFQHGYRYPHSGRNDSCRYSGNYEERS